MKKILSLIGLVLLLTLLLPNIALADNPINTNILDANEEIYFEPLTFAMIWEHILVNIETIHTLYQNVPNELIILEGEIQ